MENLKCRNKKIDLENKFNVYFIDPHMVIFQSFNSNFNYTLLHSYKGLKFLILILLWTIPLSSTKFPSKVPEKKICKENISQTFLIANQKHDSLTTLDKQSKQKKSIKIFPPKIAKTFCFWMIHSVFGDPKKEKTFIDYKIVAILVNRDLFDSHARR